MATEKQRGDKSILLALAVLTAAPAQAQTVPVVGASRPPDRMSATIGSTDDRNANPFTSPVSKRETAPRITLSADRDTIFGSLEDLHLLVERSAAGNRLVVTVKLEQDQEWLVDRSHDVTIRAGDTTAVLTIPRGDFKSNESSSGELTATVDNVDDYDTGDAKATVFVISQEDPVVTYSLSRESYTFAEDVGRARAEFVARMAPGMPRGVTVSVLMATRGKESSREGLTATAGEDYEPVSGGLMMVEGKYEIENGRWVGRTSLILPFFDDDVREGTETFELFLQPASGPIDVAQLVTPDGTPCGLLCRYLIHISDEEDIPAMELEVSPTEIMEEGETSSTATLSISDHKSFAADQVLTLALAGTATKGIDYAVAPGDADEATPGYQVILPVQSNSVGMTFKAIRDEVNDPDEKIEVSPELDGSAMGDMQAIRIVNRQMAMPRITLSADRDTIIAGLETLELTLTREAPLDESLMVTVQLAQDQSWLSDTSRDVTFGTNQATATLFFVTDHFSTSVVESGNLTASVDPVSGYDIGDATATVFVVSLEGPAVIVSLTHSSYAFAEDDDDTDLILSAQMASGMPRGATVMVSVSSQGRSSSSELTALSGRDYSPISEMPVLREQDYALENGRWVARQHLAVTLLDDDVREGRERFQALLNRSPGNSDKVQFLNADTSVCSQSDCPYLVFIVDDEDIPALDLSVSAEEIREEEESSATATVSITNGKTFAHDQMVTFRLGGDAILGSDYRVTPADADEGTPDHQVALPAGSSSVELTFTAQDDDREEGDEEIRVRATHDGDAIGSETIRIVDRFPGPRVEITFEGVRSPRDEYDDGIATGPFTTRITFSEPVEGFTQEDIDWQTHSGTTVDTTNIAVLLWDYTEVRAGLEYTARMMPDQNGRLHILVSPYSARSVATGDGNQLGHGSLQVELPPNRMMVEPRALTVDEGDEDGTDFMVSLTSKPTGTVTVTVSGMDGTEVDVDRPTLTFRLPYWSGGWGVRVTAGDDANTRDETVTLRVTASGGGYDGKSANVVVRVKDDDAVAGGDVDDEAAALVLLEGMTPEAAAAALFGEEDLSEAQLGALDRLGNGNGSYDLGDLLSWIARCRRGEANCGGPSPDPRFGAAAALLSGGAAGRNGRASHRQRRDSRSGTRRHPGHRTGRRSRRAGWHSPRADCRRRSASARYGLALLLATTLTWACADDIVQPPIEPDPGYLTVQLTVPPAARDIGAMLVVDGPGIDSVRAPGFELFLSDASSSSRREIIVSGAISSGPVLEIHVPDRNDHAEYRVRLLQVSGEDYTLKDLAPYSAVISR